MTSRPAGTKRAFGSDSRSAARAAAGWLCAAAPTFAVVALLTALAGGASDPLCAAMQRSSPLGGMIFMYLLMSAFHSAPWLKLIGSSTPVRRRLLGGAGKHAPRRFKWRCNSRDIDMPLEVGSSHSESSRRLRPRGRR